MLFNEPKLLKLFHSSLFFLLRFSFSALQRAEIAEIRLDDCALVAPAGFSALQRAEIAEIETTLLRKECERKFQCSSTSRNC